MRNIVHILDDVALGGVTRLLDSLLPALDAGLRHERIVQRTQRRLPPRLRADVIVVHFTMAWSKLPFLAALRLAHPAARLILVEHSYTAGFEACCVSHRARFRALLRASYGLVNHVVAVSQGQAAWMRAAGLARAGHVHVIPCVPDLAPFAAVPPAAPHTGPLRLGAFGRYAPQKGFDTLIEAMRLVAPECAHLTLAGYGEDEASLREAAATLPHVQIRGRVNPVAFLSEMDAIAMPSRWEAGAVSCWELRAAGRPCIVSDVDGLPEQVPAARGLVVPPEDPAMLAEAIRALAGADRVAMGVEARASVEGAFARVIEAWEDLLF